MSPELKALIRKEWQQQQKYFWVMLLILIGLETVLLLLNPELAVLFLVLTALSSCYLGIMVASSVVNSESTARTDSFYQSLPVARQTKAAVKLSMGGVVLLTPLCLAYVYDFLLIQLCAFLDILSPKSLEGLNPDFGNNSIWKLAIFSLIVALSFYLWTAGIAHRAGTFIRTAASGLAILVFAGFMFSLPILFVVMFPTNARAISQVELEQMYSIVMLLNSWNPLVPFAILSDMDISKELPNIALVVQFIVAAALAFEFIRNYGTETPEVKRDFVLRITSWFSDSWMEWTTSRLQSNILANQPNRHSVTRLLISQQLRSQRPLLFLLLLLGCYLGVYPVIYAWNKSLLPLRQSANDILLPLFFTIGLPGMILLGTTVFLPDRSLTIQSFWRSLPLSPTRWLTTKFLSSLLVSCFCLLGPFLLMNILFNAYGWPTTILVRGCCHLVAHFTLAASLFWLIGNPLHSAVLTIGYSALIHGIFMAIGPGFHYGPSFDLLLTSQVGAHTGMFYLIFGLLMLPPLVLLVRQRRQYRLTAW
ncbi:MAG: hypothetical protein KDA65_01750 [Planctomycetaceae bacterium]|nr:hypothetical protein [Planctomycetaceae bacterium]